MGEARIESLGVRYYGELASGTHPLIVNAALVGLFQRSCRHGHRSERARGRQGARHRPDRVVQHALAQLPQPAVGQAEHERRRAVYVEGTVVPGYGPRLVLLNGVPLEAPLPGTTILFMNNDQPGVIGEIGTILGKHGH
jgi:D-3-phosphoglycerate dehydrogenase